MSNNLYTPETARWYGLLSRAQSETGRYLDSELEAYVADMLYRFAVDGETVLRYTAPHLLAWNSEREKRLINLQGAGERCLVTAGFFPEHANYAGLSLLHFIDTGRSAYRDLAKELPGADLYRDVDVNFIQLVDVLQKTGELSGVCRPFDLIQASELWQQAGSLYGLRLIERETSSLPMAEASHLTH